ncbi:MAG: hypothetical protein COS88_04580 [Chloroflexi bacterium CG07_land_8_20_14_0_80_51_10]|nr:MAG: hypothetical protein COS88_04580 [Chloroflexi bacterium CG07_land_8_20_14_0_80_51_10]
MFHPMYTEELGSAKKFMHDLPRIEKGTFQAIACSPLEWTKIEPDFVLVFGNPAQIYRLAIAIIWKKEDTALLEVKIPCDDALCTYGLAQAYLTEEPQFVFPGYGERVVSYTGDNELAFVIPAKKLPQIVEGLENTYRGKGAYPVRYPLPFMIEKEPELAEVEVKALNKLLNNIKTQR